MTDMIRIRVNSQDINYINRIMEGYEHLGVVTTVNKEEGVLAIRVTPDTRREVETILNHLPVSFQFV
ncbi:Hypothetical protein LUCI_1228 [Lucifera butyrica]|uniref:DUF4911 domain-containing protein n=1 Tax=Lucifera butyrica TaxID=1351585 RepID=A0A498R5B6_9FIRM|nr:DUF4911 domain-containing protein [Lucifera butyrica]VBB06017.1 Hypothetical protein LUCI_1228 [Lucifera butyrica]